jgi:hypothetical protein
MAFRRLVITTALSPAPAPLAEIVSSLVPLAFAGLEPAGVRSGDFHEYQDDFGRDRAAGFKPLQLSIRYPQEFCQHRPSKFSEEVDSDVPESFWQA